MSKLKKISVIMPVLNEAKTLKASLECLGLSDGEDLVVVDGGSTDGTIKEAEKFAARVAVSDRGRARQMNRGAELAQGGILLFLHADCRLPEGAFTTVRRTLNEPSVAAGAFDIRIDHPSLWFRLIEGVANMRSRLTGVPYGDQGLFMRREVFMGLGGFSDIPLMEDVEIAGRLRKAGRIAFVKERMTVSPRRWLKEGKLYTTLRDWSAVAAFALLGVRPERLARYYRDIR